MFLTGWHATPCAGAKRGPARHINFMFVTHNAQVFLGQVGM